MVNPGDLKVDLIDFASGNAICAFDTDETIRRTSHRLRSSAVYAKPHQRFAINVQLRREFDWRECNALEINIGFDMGEEVNSRSIYVLKNKDGVEQVDLPQMILKDDCYNYRIDDLLVEAPGNSPIDVLRCNMYFCPLRDDDKVQWNKNQKKSLEGQGKIRIEVFRAEVTARLQEYGLLKDPSPSLRRLDKAKLLEASINLEVLLSPEGEATYRGNFRPKCYRDPDTNSQATFEFVYREDGHHRAKVAPEDIEEISSVISKFSRLPLTPRDTPSRASTTTARRSISQCTSPARLGLARRKRKSGSFQEQDQSPFNAIKYAKVSLPRSSVIDLDLPARLMEQFQDILSRLRKDRHSKEVTDHEDQVKMDEILLKQQECRAKTTALQSEMDILERALRVLKDQQCERQQLSDRMNQRVMEALQELKGRSGLY